MRQISGRGWLLLRYCRGERLGYDPSTAPIVKAEP